MRTIQQSLDGFTDKYARLQTFRNVIQQLRNDGHVINEDTIDEVLIVFEEKINQGNLSKLRINMPMKPCPNCDTVMRLFPLDFETEEGHKSIWRCTSCIGCKQKDKNDESNPEDYCTYEEKITKSYEEIMAEFNK